MDGSKEVFREDAIAPLLDAPGRRLLDFWKGAATQGVPARQAFEPLDHPKAWPGIQLVEADPRSDRFRYRLVGTREVDIRGRDPTGELVAEGYFGASAESVLENYRLVRDEKAPICVLGRYMKRSGVPTYDISLFLPLAGADGAVRFILVYSYQTLDDPRASPKG